ncbi:MAG: autotransporter outer membrane beta-barrel domain-containing protein [Deltaproteobacteria bacterium]|nr:autotransporter outer membrane beta-barrel domain-containing protein [Deltaproteobacteria bacterium]
MAFGDAESSRARAGARLAFAPDGPASPYVGVAYEREFDGKVRASAFGVPIEEPSLRGGTGMGELGVTVRPSESLPFSFDLGAQAFAGKRQGVAGSL